MTTKASYKYLTHFIGKLRSSSPLSFQNPEVPVQRRELLRGNSGSPWACEGAHVTLAFLKWDWLMPKDSNLLSGYMNLYICQQINSLKSLDMNGIRKNYEYFHNYGCRWTDRGCTVNLLLMICVWSLIGVEYKRLVVNLFLVVKNRAVVDVCELNPNSPSSGWLPIHMSRKRRHLSHSA